MIALLLRESVKFDKKPLSAGDVHEFDEATAQRLLATGAAVVPPEAPRLPAREVIVEKEVQKTVQAFSEAGHRFLKIKSPKAAAEFVREQKEAAVHAELLALELRREEGPRAEVVDAIGIALAGSMQVPK